VLADPQAAERARRLAVYRARWVEQMKASGKESEQMKASGKESEQGTEQGPQAENIVRGCRFGRFVSRRSC
jgi:hypothetical protein